MVCWYFEIFGSFGSQDKEFNRKSKIPIDSKISVHLSVIIWVSFRIRYIIITMTVYEINYTSHCIIANHISKGLKKYLLVKSVLSVFINLKKLILHGLCKFFIHSVVGG